MRAGNIIMIVAGLIVLLVSGVGTSAAIGWLSARTTIEHRLGFVRGIRPDFQFAQTVSEVVELARSSAATRVVLSIAPASADGESAAAEEELAQSRLETALLALRTEGLDATGVPVDTRLRDAVADAQPVVHVEIRRMGD